MTKTRDDLKNLVDDVRRLRDELEVKLHLAAAEARDEWATLEKKWQHFRGRAERVGEAAADTAGEVGEALALAGEELKKGYQRIRKLL